MDDTDFDEFEAEFAAELEAMEDFEGGSPSCKPKKSLNFATPSTKNRLNDSVIEPLDDSDNNNGMEKATLTGSTTLGKGDGDAAEAAKRKRLESDEKAKAAKRQKTMDADLDDWDITPPPSPSRMAAPSRPRNVLDEINDRLMKDYDFDRARVLRRIPAGDFVSVTTDEGRRFYMGVQTETARILKAREKFEAKQTMSLLSLPYQELKQQVLDARRSRLEEATEETLQDLDTGDAEMDETDGLVEGMASLWVDRYSPKGYMDLLSDEGTNRTLLHWLKLWDHVVFGREVRKKEKPKKENKFNKFEKRDFRKEQLDAEMELDSLNRPFHKVVLLCGPPGLGKTTLAHVLAHHAGYKVSEINASDDRSAEVFKNKIDAAIQMKSVIGADPRPICLVIDEIDGAPQPAINQLIALIKGGNEGDVKDAKKKKSVGPLLRPIICICNDQYALSLRQLRPLALVMNFPPTLSMKLTGRLLDICVREGLKADQTTLLALANKTDNDIRSCINTLQFFRGKKKDLQLRDVQTRTFAQKDVHKGLFNVWQEIFQRPRQNKRQYVNPYDRTTMSLQEMTRIQSQQNNTSSSSRFYHIHGLASTAGEYDKVTMGLFDNFLNQNIKDPRMAGVNLANTWLCHVDTLNARIGRTQDYSAYAYLPYTMVVFHLLFAATQVNKLQYPHSDGDARQKLMTSQSLVSSLMDEMSTNIRHHLNVKSVVMDVLPPLMDIIQPSFRPINTQLYSAREKADLNKLIRVMVEYNLTYRQDKAPDGHYTYVLEPQVDQLVKFPGMKQRKQMTYAAKQLVAREIDLEKMRRADGPGQASAAGTSATPGTGKTTKDKQQDQVPNHQKILKPKHVEEKDLVTRDFFGRKIEAGAEQPQMLRKKKKGHDDGSELLSRDVWYHFKEGYSNAVRKTVHVQDMM